jgi:hypothetical protein
MYHPAARVVVSGFSTQRNGEIAYELLESRGFEIGSWEGTGVIRTHIMLHARTTSELGRIAAAIKEALPEDAVTVVFGKYVYTGNCPV